MEAFRQKTLIFMKWRLKSLSKSCVPTGLEMSAKVENMSNFPTSGLYIMIIFVTQDIAL